MNDDPLLQPRFGSAALITIDVQRDTLDDAPGEIPGTSSVLPGIVQLARVFRRVQRPIVHMVRLYLKDGSNVDLCRQSMVRSGAPTFIYDSEGAQLADDLAPSQAQLDAGALLAGSVQELGPHEVAIYKPRWGAFFETPLRSHLDTLGIDTLVFCGANFPNCPRTSIYEASERDYRLVLARDAISRFSDEGLEQLSEIGVNVLTVDDIRHELDAIQRFRSPRAGFASL